MTFIGDQKTNSIDYFKNSTPIREKANKKYKIDITIVQIVLILLNELVTQKNLQANEMIDLGFLFHN